jgi:hypothetical protein
VKILFYSSTSQGCGIRIEEGLSTLVPGESVEVYRSIDDLANRLKRLLDHDAIAILQVRAKEELLDLVSISNLLQDVRVILLLSDREEETISLAHRLRPRFLANSESGFSDTMSVVRKMLGYGG